MIRLEEDSVRFFAKALALTVVGSALLLGLTGCSSTEGKSSGPLSTLNVALLPNMTHAQGLVGKENGDFQKALGSQTKISWRTFNAGPDEVQAFLTGAEDVGYIGPGPAVTANLQSHGDIQIVAGATTGGTLLVARKGSNIKSWKDLAGKSVSVPQYGNTQHLLLLDLLKRNGLKDTSKGGTVEVKAANNSDISTLFDQGSLDAALVPEPWASTLIQEDGAQVVYDQNTLWRNGQYATTVVVARKDFIQEHPKELEAFLKAHVQLTDYLNKDPEDAQKAINSQTYILTKKKLSSNVLASSLKNTPVSNDPIVDSVLEFSTFAKEDGYLNETADKKTLFDFTALNRVLTSLGKATISS
ncbi:MAG TPA: sulfate ABC transporter substrate-binding protein [Ruminococcaceae bacterium]|nr:sulfate ABC transporter substrate-binding protein [Oscillospiraceae bacterium]